MLKKRLRKLVIGLIIGSSTVTAFNVSENLGINVIEKEELRTAIHEVIQNNFKPLDSYKSDPSYLIELKLDSSLYE